MQCFADFLAADFERIGGPLLARAARIDGKRLILSGATGFFGANLLALLSYLYGRGARFEVSALSRDPAAFFARHTWARSLSWLSLQAGDVRKPWPMQSAHELMLHAATDTKATAHRDPQAVFDDQLLGTRRALEAAAACGIRRLLLTGSGAQYGGPQPQDGFDEDAAQACDPTSATSAYGEGKRVAELLAALFAQKHDCAVVNTRCFAFVGPGLPLDGHFAIGNFIGDALAGRSIQLASTGAALRSYLYGADLALWLLLLLLEAPGGSSFNVGSDEGVTVLALAQRVGAALAPELQVTAGISADNGPRLCYLPRISRARSCQGLDVWTPLDLAITRTAAWHRARST